MESTDVKAFHRGGEVKTENCSLDVGQFESRLSFYDLGESFVGFLLCGNATCFDVGEGAFDLDCAGEVFVGDVLGDGFFKGGKIANMVDGELKVGVEGYY